ncbi:MAG: TRAP transporter large permease subunit [Spirochaetota bacterium]|nr:TRAP transporter large permease subunit [Spirochaetota bacterium]
MILLAIIFIVIIALLGAPIFVVVSSFAILGFLSADIHLSAIVVDVYNNFANTPLLYTIPLFAFTGYILAESKTSTRIINVSKALVGWMPGGLAIVSLVTCAFFTAFTGASGVTIIALGGILYPSLIKERYPEKFSLGLLTSSGSLGLLFAPSLPIIMYGAVSETNIIHLFVAGLIPGILLIIILSIYSTYTAKMNRLPKAKVSFMQVVKAVNEAKWELVIPVIIIVGIFGGFVTLGEVAAITIAYSLIIEIYIYKDIKLKNIPLIMKQSMILVGGILIIMGSAYGLTNYMVDAEIPMVILNFMRTYITSKIVFLIILNIFLLIVGCLLDIYSAILVVVPLILPIAKSYGVDPVHLGIIFLTNLEIGYSTPPVGMNLFISSFRFKKSIISLYGAAIPFLGLLLIGLLIITYVPQLSLGLIDFLGIK